MREYRYITSQQELEKLIGQYFDGMTTIDEEKALRWTLAQCQWRSEVIDEARVVMGYFASHRQQHHRHKAWATGYRVIGIAASIAILLAVGTYALWHLQQPGDQCIAYVNGQVVQSDDQVMAMVADDLSRIDNAANVMTDQLSSMGEAIEIDNE